MRYGHFDDHHREYVITRPDTPLPWINYLGCEAYFGIISNTAGGYSFYRDARLRRLTRYRYNNVPLDSGGRYIYLRDNESGEFWSPSWQPTRTDLDSTPAATAWAYTDHRFDLSGIQAETLYFVPLGENLEIWQLTRDQPARRRRPSSRSSRASSSACGTRRTTPPTSSATSAPGRWRSRTGSSTTRPSTASGAIISPISPARDQLAGFDTQREAFLGAYRGWDTPAGGRARRIGQLRRPRLGADRLAPRASSTWSPARPQRSSSCWATTRTRWTRSSTRPTRRPSTSRQSSRSSPDTSTASERRRGFQAAARVLGRLLGICQVETPDLHTNRMVNIWNAYQCMATFNMSRSASFYRIGHRARHWASAIPTRTCWASSTWSRRAPASASSTWPPRSCRPAAPITSISR